MKQLFSALVLLFLSSCTPGPEGPAGSTLEARVTRIENGLTPILRIEGREPVTFNVVERLKELNIPGLSVAFVANGVVEWTRSYGMADVSENRPMRTDTLLLAGSISKPIAALRAHQLVEKGVFDLDENINTYLKSWQIPDNEFTKIEKVTLRRILTHTAGLTVWGFPGYDKGDNVPSVVDVLDGLGNTDPVRVFRQPGEAWQYSGGGYTIMQLAITDTERVSFPETMQNNVLDQIQMEDSTFDNPLPSGYHARAATGYRVNGDEVEGKWPIYPEMAAAGLWTTPSELIQYAIEIQGTLQSRHDGLLKYNTVVEMLNANGNEHGLGPAVADHTFGHGGADEGFRARLIAWKNEPYAAVVMVNSDNGSIITELLLSVADEYGLPGVEPTFRKLANIQAGALQKFAGNYELEGVGPIEISATDDRLRFYNVDWDSEAWILPQSDIEFFNSVDGSLIRFDVQNDTVVGFDTEGLRGVRSD